jgi:hypothetical protein
MGPIFEESSQFDLFTNSVLDDINNGFSVGNAAVLLPTCFDESTEILSLNNNFEEVYVPISELKNGSLVKTFKHGYRKIIFILKHTFINDVNNIRSTMYILPKNENMTKDLIVTGGHSILVDSIDEDEYNENFKTLGNEDKKIDEKFLLLSSVSKKFKRLENSDKYNVYHFILEDDGDTSLQFGVWANGILTETISKENLIRGLLV